MPEVVLKSGISIDGKIREAGERVSVSNALAKNLLNRGKAEPAEPVVKDYSDMKLDELKEEAEAAGIEGFSSMKKADLIDALVALDDGE